MSSADFGEAVSVVDEGIAAGKLKASDPDIAAILKDSKPKVPTPADLAAAEKAARIPTAYIRVGDRYYAAGNYQKAADLYREALAKGADAGLANLRLGEGACPLRRQGGSDCRVERCRRHAGGPCEVLAAVRQQS